MRYLDIRNDIIPHPVTGDILSQADEQSIINEIKNLVFTDKYERFWDPKKGAGVPQTLFENLGKDTEKMLEIRVREVINTYCKRVTDVSVVVKSNQNFYDCEITFTPINSIDKININTIFKRTR